MPPSQSKAIRAAIDVGSNSVHMLVARLRDRRDRRFGALVPVDDRSDLVGLGDVVHASGMIPPEPLQVILDSLHAMRRFAHSEGATDIVVMGTEPLRRATNADELVTAVERYLGLPMHVLTERQEAELTFLGVTAGRVLTSPMAVIDIGGGSTEVAIHVPGQRLGVVPLAIGSARLTASVVRHDPPTQAEIQKLLALAEKAVADAQWPEIGRGSVAAATFVGGTATNIARLGRLDPRHLDEDLETLARLPAAAVITHFGVRPRRARQLAAGVAIVRAVLGRLALSEADVSDGSLRDGAILARAACGPTWLSALDDTAG